MKSRAVASLFEGTVLFRRRLCMHQSRIAWKSSSSRTESVRCGQEDRNLCGSGLLTRQEIPEPLKDRIPNREPEPSGEGYRIRVSYPFISPLAKESVVKAIEAGTISSATSVIKDFESELAKHFNVTFAKACSSGYSALVLALKLAKVKSGDHVLIPTFTMAAVVNAVVAVGAQPTFVDCEKSFLNPSLQQFRERMTPKTAALIITHTYGVPADCLELQEFCKANGLVFIEDIAEAIGINYQGNLVGTFGDFACASLYANKTITSGDGGFVLASCQTAEADQLMLRADSYINHGFTKNYHFLHCEFSGNYKMSGLQAAFVTPAVANISKVTKDRARITSEYRKELGNLPDLTLIPTNPYGEDAPWMFGVIVASKYVRTVIRQKMAEDGIETRNFFYPLHLQPMMFKTSDNHSIENLPNAERLGETGFYLPTFYGMTVENIKIVCESLKNGLHFTSNL